jgi:hypothetical protein
MPNALVSGPGRVAVDIADALRAGGFESICADGPSDLVDVCAAAALNSLDCYVQLPAEHRSVVMASAGPLATVAAGGRARYHAVTTVAPLLTENSTVVLVMENQAEEPASSSLTRVLAQALRHDYRSTRITVTLVEDPGHPAEIVSAVRFGQLPSAASFSYLDFEPDLGFADWRVEVLSLLNPRT